MLFTALRKYENGDTCERLNCKDSDFIIALRLVSTYLRHSLLLFNNLPKQSEMTVFRSGNNKRIFFDSLPREFKRSEAIELGGKYNFSKRTVDTMLKEFLGKFLEQPQFGIYRKL